MPGSIRVNRSGTGGSLNRTTNLPSISNFTIMGWFYAITQTNSRTLFSFGSTGSPYYYVQLTGTAIKLDNNVNVFTGAAFSTARWYHVALTVAGTGANQALLYRDGALDVTGDGDTGPAAQAVYFGNTEFGGGDAFLGYITAPKMYNRVLTAGEIAAEMQFAWPVSWGALNSACPFPTEWDRANYSNLAIPHGATSSVMDLMGNEWTVSATTDVVTDLAPPIQFAPPRYRYSSRIFVPAAAGGARRRIRLCN